MKPTAPLQKQAADILRLIGSNLQRGERSALAQTNREVGTPIAGTLRRDRLALQREQWGLALPELLTSTDVEANERYLEAYGARTLNLPPNRRALWRRAFNSLHYPPPPLTPEQREATLRRFAGYRTDPEGFLRGIRQSLFGRSVIHPPPLTLSMIAASQADFDLFLEIFAVDGERYASDGTADPHHPELTFSLLQAVQTESVYSTYSVPNRKQDAMEVEELLKQVLTIRGSDLNAKGHPIQIKISFLIRHPILLQALLNQGWEPTRSQVLGFLDSLSSSLVNDGVTGWNPLVYRSTLLLAPQILPEYSNEVAGRISWILSHLFMRKFRYPEMIASVIPFLLGLFAQHPELLETGEHLFLSLVLTHAPSNTRLYTRAVDLAASSRLVLPTRGIEYEMMTLPVLGAPVLPVVAFSVPPSPPSVQAILATRPPTISLVPMGTPANSALSISSRQAFAAATSWVQGSTSVPGPVPTSTQTAPLIPVAPSSRQLEAPTRPIPIAAPAPSSSGVFPHPTGRAPPLNVPLRGLQTGVRFRIDPSLPALPSAGIQTGHRLPVLPSMPASSGAEHSEVFTTVPPLVTKESAAAEKVSELTRLLNSQPLSFLRFLSWLNQVTYVEEMRTSNRYTLADLQTYSPEQGMGMEIVMDLVDSLRIFYTIYNRSKLPSEERMNRLATSYASNLPFLYQRLYAKYIDPSYVPDPTQYTDLVILY